MSIQDNKIEESVIMSKVIAFNRRAGFDYALLERYEAGIVLNGCEVKSLRAGRTSLKDSYASLTKSGEAMLHNLYIAPYEQGNRYNEDPYRSRKLLLHKNELYGLAGKLSEKGATLVPVKLYFKKGRAKLEIALAKGKRKYDKRESILKRESQREIDRKLKEYRR